MGGRHSIRARMTIATVIVFGVVLLAGTVAISLTYPARARADLFVQAATASRRLTMLIDDRRFTGPIPAQGPVTLLQVVDERGQVLAASESLTGRPALTAARPHGGDSRVDDRVCRPRGCLVVVGTSNRATAYGPAVAYAAVREPYLLRSPLLPVLLYGSAALLLALLGWGAWYGTGRVLAPVERIRRDLQRISAEDLTRRVEVPPARDEVAELAGTVNDTLARLEDAVARHRRFVSDASHELRSPITAMLVRLEAGLEERDEADWRAALADARRLSDIVQDLLLMARLDAAAPAGQEEDVDLGRLAADEIERRGGRLPVTADLRPGVVVRGNRLRLARLLTNLLSNADRYGGSRVSVRVRAEDGQAVLEVRDDGPGIPEDMRERVFERFTRLDRTRSRDSGGSGLGLPIARDIARAHGGTLSATDGPGACLVLRLPLAPT
ncbi:HAMP domain-containing histidine kinase [Actinomadura sp. ATCC 31491]|uniref:histidine kinase n=1 Tax=Actinomadura luzonensis TaxID=2805427 RepID=A0ABT0FZI0_9ACTN|nr:HAMP domain-containing sensor histidine kinase [Actinomadura luzonensis]MCK2217350.1 HAMP domain-containing histidine kinase [Actinomadura luzonensis]